MPQGQSRDRVGPSSSLLDRLMRSLPSLPRISPEEQERMDVIARAEQEKWPEWKKNLSRTFDTGWGVLEGLMGTEPDPERRSGRDWANLITQGVGAAGLPFSAYRSKLPLSFLTHGTQRKFETFDPSKYDKADVLGWLTHAAEDPSYSGMYAMGQTKGMKTIPEEGTLYSSIGKAYDPRQQKYVDVQPRMIPIVPEAKNVLDLVDPNPDDMSAALASLNEFERKKLIEAFKKVRGIVKRNQGEMPALDLADRLGIDPRHIRHRGEELTHEELPVRYLAEKLRLDQQALDKSQFDAIRYNDMSQKSWAFPAKTPLKTPYGVPLNTAPTDLPVIKSMFGGQGTLEVAKNRRVISPNAPADYSKLSDDFIYPTDASTSAIINGEGLGIYPGMSGQDITDAKNDIDILIDKGKISQVQYEELMGKIKQHSGAPANSSWFSSTNEEGFPTMFGKAMTKQQADLLYDNNVISPEEYNKFMDLHLAKQAKSLAPKPKQNKMVYYNDLPGYDEDTAKFKLGTYTLIDPDTNEQYPANFITTKGTQFLKELLAQGHKISNYTAPGFGK